MPDAGEPQYLGAPLVAQPAGRGGGAHALVRTAAPKTTTPGPDAPAGDPSLVDNGETVLTTTHIAVATPRHRIQKRAPLLWTIEGIWSWIIVGGLQVGWYLWNDHTMGFWNWVVVALTVPLAFMGIVVAPWWQYLVARWDVSDSAICSRTGWWTMHYRIAPLSRLQTVYTTRNVFERMMGLSTVHASTASAHGSVQVRGLLREDAERLAEHLISIAELDEGDAT